MYDINSLKEMYSYDADAGMLSRKRAGCSLPFKTSHGYIAVEIKHKRLYAHRVAWALFYGNWPAGQIDHIDMDKTNNRISNLRDVSSAENKQNKPRQSNNKSGLKGVWFSKVSNKWTSQITINGKRKHLGLFDTKESAYDAYIEAAGKYHKYNRVCTQ